MPPTFLHLEALSHAEVSCELPRGQLPSPLGYKN